MLKPRVFVRVGIFLACLMPFILLLVAGAMGNLGANPVQNITQETGAWTLRFLMITLCITPFRKLSGWNDVVRFRRMLGLFAFLYGFLHLMTYLWLDQFFSVSEIAHDVVNRPFITAGTVGFLLMVPSFSLPLRSQQKNPFEVGNIGVERGHISPGNSIAGLVEAKPAIDCKPNPKLEDL